MTTNVVQNRSGNRIPKRGGSAREVLRILNCLPSQKRERDWIAASAYDAGTLALTAPPPSKDLREPWWTIGDQKDTGSCVGWAAADSVIRWAMAKAGKLAEQPKARLSPRYVWMASKETDDFTTRPTSFIESDGTSLKAALDIARRYGVVLESTLPFQGGPLYTGTESTFYSLAAQRRIASYVTLRSTTSEPQLTLLAGWRLWLATGGPILTRLEVDMTWDNVGSDGSLKTYKPYPPPTVRGGHAVAMVGYTKDHFIVRNSWGTTWGEGGFAYASNAYAHAAFTEAYGVTV
jgi:hypothetical protein